MIANVEAREKMMREQVFIDIPVYGTRLDFFLFNTILDYFMI